MTKEKLAIFVLISAGAILTLLGCAKRNSDRSKAATHGKFYAVITEQTAFYHYGPQQSKGPDMQLTKDTLLTVIRRSFGYSKVKLISGESGYVSSDDIRLAPSPEFEPTPIPDLMTPN
jgi:hypothetical protein